MKAPARLLVVSGLLVLTLAGCTGGAPPAATQAPAAAKEAPAAPPAAPKSEAAPAAKAAAPASKSVSAAELATYSGPDRQQILEAGARQEGQLMLYTSGILTQAVRPLLDAFMAKYPFIKVDFFRANNDELVLRINQEYDARRYDFDVLETTVAAVVILREAGRLQAFQSPEYAAYPKTSLDPEGFYAPVRESYVGLGYNTKLINGDEAPRSFDDLLDPRWKGKMTVTADNTGYRFVGNLLITKGEDFVRKLRDQQLRTQAIDGRALADLMIAGEVPLSPTIFDSHALNSKKQGAPIDWRPLEPTTVNLGVVCLAQRSPHPNASLLFLDFALSEEGQKIYRSAEYGSARQGMGGTSTDFRKLYLESQVKDYASAYEQWQKLFKTTFGQS